MQSSFLPTRDVGTLDFTLRYQRTPCAKYHVRPLSLLQQDVMYRCDGTVTLADLSDATKYSHPEIRAVLRFLSKHGLIKTLPPDPRLLAATQPASCDPLAPALPRSNRGLWSALKRKLRLWDEWLWHGLTWDVH